MSSLGEKERYQGLQEHFNACADGTDQERRDYLTRLAVSEPDTARELEELLRHHHSGPAKPVAPKPAPVAKDARPARRRKSRWATFPVVTILVTSALLAAVGVSEIWCLRRLQDQLRADMGQGLRGSLDYRVKEIRAWAAHQVDLARKVLEDPALATDVAVLADIAKEPAGLKDRLLASPAFARVSARMQKAPLEIADRGFVVILPSGVDVCAETPDIVGRVVSQSGAAYVRRVNLGESFVSRPYPDRQFAMGVSPDYQNPVMFVTCPIREAKGAIIGMGVFRFSPTRFYQMLRPTTVEFVAFDDKGTLLNNLEDAELFRKAGLLPEEPNVQTWFRTYLRDPGVRLDRGEKADSAPDTWPETLMCRSAVQGKDGVDDAGHRDLRGRRVLAAWSWLPEWEMGIGAQIPLDRALKPAQPVERAFLTIFAILGVVSVWLLVMSRLVQVVPRARDTRFGSYTLERRIGKGGMAEVHLARHEVLKRAAAVKILSATKPDDAAVERFEREARLASRLAHPNTVQIFDYGETLDGKLFYAMEYVEGVNLAQLLTVEPELPVSRVVYILQQIAGSLEEAHQLGLCHRDLKPSNVMVCAKGGLADVVKVLDFGIAVAAGGPAEDATQSPHLIGTPVFIAPERIRSPQLLDPRSDIYSFGAVAFQLLTGRQVFEGPGPAELIYQVMSAERPRPSLLRGKPLPAALEKLVLDCLSVDPDRRPADFRIVASILNSVPLSDPWGQEQARTWWSSNRDRIQSYIQAVT